MSNDTHASDPLLNVLQLSAHLNVPTSWIYDRTRKRGEGRIPHLKLGKYLRFRLGEVLSWLNNFEEK